MSDFEKIQFLEPTEKSFEIEKHSCIEISDEEYLNKSLLDKKSIMIDIEESEREVTTCPGPVVKEEKSKKRKKVKDS